LKDVRQNVFSGLGEDVIIAKVGTNHLHYVECCSVCLFVDRIKVVLGLAGSNVIVSYTYGTPLWILRLREIIMVGVVLYVVSCSRVVHMGTVWPLRTTSLRWDKKGGRVQISLYFVASFTASQPYESLLHTNGL
jgi:hypothetical protein